MLSIQYTSAPAGIMASVYIIAAIFVVAGGIMYTRVSRRRGRFRPTAQELKYAGLALLALLLLAAIASR